MPELSKNYSCAICVALSAAVKIELELVHISVPLHPVRVAMRCSWCSSSINRIWYILNCGSPSLMGVFIFISVCSCGGLS